ncbi:MAG: alkyl sulfatase C-terminal domain-containing protein, partial [Herbaspirillum sp.]
ASTWRNAYLTGAMELRGGVPQIPARSSNNPDTLKAVSNERYFDYMAVRLDAAKAEGKKMVINWNFTDSKQRLALTLENSALTHAPGQARNADATLTLSRATLDAITLKQTTFPEAVQAGQIKIDGDRAKISELLGMLDTFEQMFPVVEPKK